MRPSATAAVISGVAIGTAPTSIPRLARISLSTKAGAVSAPALRLYPMRSVPSSPAAALRAVSHARSTAASAGAADSAKAAPAVVNTTLRVLRTNRAVPSSASNRRIRTLSAGCAIPIRAAARVKFNSCASFEQAVAAYESEAYQKALVALPDGFERDFRIIEGID